MKKWIIALLILVWIVTVAAGYIAGIVHAIRVERGLEAIESGEPQPRVPFNGCNTCAARWPEWMCWLSGCST